MSMPPTPAGWYQDPEAPSHERWWDGTAWTPHLRIAQGQGLDPGQGQQAGQSGQFGHPGQFGQPGQSGQFGQPGEFGQSGATGGFGPPGSAGSGGPGGTGGRAKVVALAAAGVVLVASIVTGVVVLGKDDKPDPGAATRTSPTAEATSPQETPEQSESSAPAGDPKVLEDQLNGITLPIPDGWEKPQHTVEKAVTMTTEGTYDCPGDAGFCHHGRVTSRTAAAGAGTDPETVAKSDIPEAAKRFYDRDVVDRRPYNGIASHSELKAERVVVAGSTGYLVRWRVRTEAGAGGYVQSVVFPKPGSESLVVVRFAFDAVEGPPLALMDEITDGIRRIGDQGGTDGGVGSTIAP
ncbi:DUF2510 domain-containing protein [Streptomyces indicus]|uniref:DUF2510 domain-containing protein n=1 Tax=Streptomyces indicus TaxID=417292 RepID=A0A1G8XLR5_9ACTN|nr:DUF2510 domain-containing protein [Streptomyces indicus]SDJ91423.1 Protein of unknown function [Streptomyces indicus]